VLQLESPHPDRMIQLRSWTTFCGLPTVNLDPFQPNEERLCFYAAWAFSRSPRPLAYSSIKVYLSGIRTSLIHFGFTFPPYSEMPLLERQLIGYRRIRHTVRRTQKTTNSTHPQPFIQLPRYYIR
jgi:hypothetical protein